MRSLCSDFQVKQELIIHTDSTAAQVLGWRDPADLMTKCYLDEITVLRHVAAMNMKKFESGKSPIAPGIIAFCGTMLGSMDHEEVLQC